MTTPTPAPAPAPEAPSAANALVVVTPTTVITKFQVLADTITQSAAAATLLRRGAKLKPL